MIGSLTFKIPTISRRLLITGYELLRSIRRIVWSVLQIAQRIQSLKGFLGGDVRFMQQQIFK